MNSKWEAIVGRSNGKRPPDKCCNSIQTIAHTFSFRFLFLQPTQTNTVWLAKIKSIHRVKWEAGTEEESERTLKNLWNSCNNSSVENYVHGWCKQDGNISHFDYHISCILCVWDCNMWLLLHSFCGIHCCHFYICAHRYRPRMLL